MPRTVKKTNKKTIRKTKATTAKKTNGPAKSASKRANKSKSRVSKKSDKTRSQTCILVCGQEKCVEACTTSSGAVTGECIPCPICGHGHFCENDFECLSCGATRELVVRPYKGA